jgi:ribosomal protein L16 Arg81 hydroxylase
MDSSSPAPHGSGQRGHGAGPDRHFPTLAWTIDPIPVGKFLDAYWERDTLLIQRKRPDYYAGLLSVDEIDRVLTTLNLHHPDVSMVDAARGLKTGDYTFASGLIDVARLYQQFAQGGTIILSQLHLFVPELANYCRAMEREFTTRFQTNIYFTPGGNAQGFKTHYDTHDVFVLQVSGSKEWKIYDTPVALPSRAQDFDPEGHKPGEVTQAFTLDPGDMVYIPRGVMHSAHSTDDLSLHITVGVIARTWIDVLLESLSQLSLDDPAYRQSLPPGFGRPDFDRGPALEQYRALVQRFLEKGEGGRALDHFADDLASTRHPLLRGQLQQILDLGALSEASWVGARPALVYRLIDKGEQVIVSCYGSDIAMPAHAAEPLRYALETERFRVRDLPGDLDDPGKLVLIRRLIREGLVMML